MKYIKQYETKITQKSLLEVISNFLNKALPNNFSIKLYQDTINIKDTNIKTNKNIGFIYILGTQKTKFKIQLSCRTLEGSNINIAMEYIINELNNNIPIDEEGREEDSSWLYNLHYNITFNPKYFENVITLFNTLPIEDLSIIMSAEKYNL